MSVQDLITDPLTLGSVTAIEAFMKTHKETCTLCLKGTICPEMDLGYKTMRTFYMDERRRIMDRS